MGLEAIVYFGIPLGEKLPNDMKDYLVNRAWEEKHIGSIPGAWGSADAMEWCAKRDAWKLTPAFVEIEYAGLNGSTYFLHCPALASVSRGKSVSIGEHLLVPDESLANLQAFCEHFGLPYAEPSWYMVAKYNE